MEIHILLRKGRQDNALTNLNVRRVGKVGIRSLHKGQQPTVESLVGASNNFSQGVTGLDHHHTRRRRGDWGRDCITRGRGGTWHADSERPCHPPLLLRGQGIFGAGGLRTAFLRRHWEGSGGLQRGSGWRGSDGVGGLEAYVLCTGCQAGRRWRSRGGGREELLYRLHERVDAMLQARGFMQEATP